jgi:ribosome-binding protein aMBF1 (putative translation factor)
MLGVGFWREQREELVDFDVVRELARVRYPERVRVPPTQQKGMSVADLAEAAGFKRRRLVRIEAGELDPRYDGLIALADGLGISVAAIMPPDPPRTDR